MSHREAQVGEVAIESRAGGLQGREGRRHTSFLPDRVRLSRQARDKHLCLRVLELQAIAIKRAKLEAAHEKMQLESKIEEFSRLLAEEKRARVDFQATQQEKYDNLRRKGEEVRREVTEQFQQRLHELRTQNSQLGLKLKSAASASAPAPTGGKTSGTLRSNAAPPRRTKVHKDDDTTDSFLLKPSALESSERITEPSSIAAHASPEELLDTAPSLAAALPPPSPPSSNSAASQRVRRRAKSDPKQDEHLLLWAAQMEVKQLKAEMEGYSSYLCSF